MIINLLEDYTVCCISREGAKFVLGELHLTGATNLQMWSYII